MVRLCLNENNLDILWGTKRL